MRNYLSYINENAKIAELKQNEYYLHIGKGIDQQGFQLYKWPKDFDKVNINQMLKMPKLLRMIANYLSENGTKSETKFLDDSSGNINWRNINKQNFKQVFNLLNTYNFIGADFIIINKNNMELIE